MTKNYSSTQSDFNGPRKTIRLSGTVKVVPASLDHESALAVAYVQSVIKASGCPSVPASTVLRMAVRLLAARISSWEPGALVSEAARVSAVRKGDSVRDDKARHCLAQIEDEEELPLWAWVSAFFQSSKVGLSGSSALTLRMGDVLCRANCSQTPCRPFA